MSEFRGPLMEVLKCSPVNLKNIFMYGDRISPGKKYRLCFPPMMPDSVRRFSFVKEKSRLSSLSHIRNFLISTQQLIT